MRRVFTSMPATAEMTQTAVSTPASAAIAGPMKSGAPGVTMMLISFFSRATCMTAESMEHPRLFSSSV